jgi:mycothiol synthase
VGDVREVDAVSVEWPGGIVARPLDKADVDAWLELLVAAEQADDGGAHPSVTELLDTFTDPMLDVARDTVSLWDGERMVGYGKVGVWPEVRDVDRVWLDGRIHPAWRRRGLGRLLLGWQTEHALAAHREHHPDAPGAFQIGGTEANAGVRALVTKAGFAPVRYFFSMECDLERKIPAVAEPEDLRLVPFELAWEEATRVAHNEAFRDHWDFHARDADDWRRTVSGSRAFRAELSQLALDGDQVAAYVMAYEYDAATEATGVRDLYIRRVGTRRPYRGRGVARALLARALTAAAAEGYERASLGVDAENPTGALGLYERMGFVAKRRFVAYSKAMP